MSKDKNIARVIKKLDEIRFKRLEGLNIGTINFIEIYELLHDKRKISYSFKQAVKCLFVKYDYSFLEIDGKVIIFLSHLYENRNDNIKQVNNLSDYIRDSKVISGKLLKTFNFNDILLNLKYLKYVLQWWQSLTGMNLSSYYKINIIIMLIDNYKWLTLLKMNEHSIRKIMILVVFFDVIRYDSIFVQYCQSLNIPTVTLQHGHFKERDLTGKDDLAGFAYQYSSSDYFFAWGRYSKEEALISGMDERKIICVGCPTYIGLKEFPRQGPSNIFGVVLAGGDGKVDNANNRMIVIANAVAKKFQMKYVLKVHPVYSTETYKKVVDSRYLYRVCNKFETIFNFAESVSFSLTMDTTVYGELLYLHSIAFRYIDKDLDDLLYKHLCDGNFHNIQDLSVFVDDMRVNKGKIEEVCDKNRAILFESGNIKDNYNNAIEFIIKNM